MGKEQSGMANFQIIDRIKLRNFRIFLCILLYPVPWLVLFFEAFVLSRVLFSCFCKMQSRFSF